MCGMWDLAVNNRSKRPRTAGPGRCAAWLAALLVTPALLGQPTAELEVQTRQPYVNEPIRVKVQVHDAQDVEPPDFPDSPNYTTSYIGPESVLNMRTDGSGRTVTVRREAFQFALTCRKAGPLTIPAIRVVADGQTLKTKPVKLTVRDVPQSPTPRPDDREQSNGAGDTENDALLLAEITCDERAVYVGQSVTFTLSIWIKPAEYNGREVSQGEMRRLLTGRIGPFDLDSERNRRAYRRAPDGSRKLYYVVEFTAEMTPDQPGPLTFDDVTLGMDYPTSFAVDRFWRTLRVAEQRPIRVRPTISVPEVQPLPTASRPAGFGGAVGRYEIKTFAVPSNVRVGDPIELVIDISGDPIEAIPGPDLGANPQLNEDFRVPTETLAGTVRGHTKRFTQVIRAKRPDVTEIPPIEFAYFDSETGEYAVARSEPIPVLVGVVEQLDAADLDIAAQPPPDQGVTLEARDGLRGNKTREAELLATAPTVTITQVALATLVPPVAFLGLLGISALTRSGRDVAIKRRRSALRNAERCIQDALANNRSPGELHSAIQAALAGYLADRLNEPPARFLGPAGVALLRERGISAELTQQWSDVTQRCEQAAYAAGGQSDADLADAARQCLSRLEQERL